MKTGIFYGTSTGNSKYVAELIEKELTGDVSLHNVETDGIASILNFDLIILGASTMENNDIQENWDKHLEDFGLLDLSGKKVAIYGTGNQEDYPLNFVDAIAMLHERVKGAGATIVGYWPTDGYSYEKSLAEMKNGRFMGLAIDEDVQPDKTPERVKAWVKQIKSEL
jgi:flavodoxin I